MSASCYRWQRGSADGANAQSGNIRNEFQLLV
jgi:hypothetical protein